MHVLCRMRINCYVCSIVRRSSSSSNDDNTDNDGVGGDGVYRESDKDFMLLYFYGHSAVELIIELTVCWRVEVFRILRLSIDLLSFYLVCASERANELDFFILYRTWTKTFYWNFAWSLLFFPLQIPIRNISSPQFTSTNCFFPAFFLLYFDWLIPIFFMYLNLYNKLKWRGKWFA